MPNMPHHVNRQEEYALRDAAEKVLSDAKDACFEVDPVCLGHLRGMEKRFSIALDLDRTLPNQIGIMKQLGDEALRLDIDYDKLIRDNQHDIEIAKNNSDTNYRLMALHSIVALGKLCEAVLAVLPETAKLEETVNKLKDAQKFEKDIGKLKETGENLERAEKLEKSLNRLRGTKALKEFAEGYSKSEDNEKGLDYLKGSLTLLGEQGEQLAEILAAIVDLGKGKGEGKGEGAHESATVNPAELAEKAPHIAKLLANLALTLKNVIEYLKYPTATSGRLKYASGLLLFFENVYDCCENAMKAYEDYKLLMRSASTLGYQEYHGWALRGRLSS